MNPSEYSILIVDDEAAIGALIQLALAEQGFRTSVATSPQEALHLAMDREPHLIVSDIMMAPMDGFAFKKQYDRLCPLHRSQFLFLSALSAPRSILTAFEIGADDYLSKPFDMELLVAKVRALLAMRARYSHRSLQGNLSDVSLSDVLAACRQKGLSGVLEIAAAGRTERIVFQDGHLADPTGSQERLSELAKLEEGLFRMDESVAAVEFDTAPAEASSAKAMGRMSSILVGPRVLEIQTETLRQPRPHVVSTVFFQGRLLHTQTRPSPEGIGLAAHQRLVDGLHQETERHIEEKVQEFRREVLDVPAAQAPAREAVLPAPAERELFAQGLTAFHRGRHGEAIELWRKSLQLNPDSLLLALHFDELLAGGR